MPRKTMRHLLTIALLATTLAAAPATRPAFVSPADKQIKAAEAAVKRKPADAGAYVNLATGFMLKARETADGAYYGRAEAACKKALALDAENYDAARTLTWVYTGLHRFAEAADLARQQIKRRPDDPFNYGTLADSLVELGQYDAAEEAVQTMVDLRPGPDSYARVSHLRELYGDPQGAVDMMASAVRAIGPGDPEHYAWARSHLGNLLFNGGRFDLAEEQYAEALRVFPDYHYALTGMGNVRMAQRRNDEAVALYRRSIDVAPTPLTVIALHDLLQSMGRKEEAAKAFALVETIETISSANGVKPDATLALFYADQGVKVAEALKIVQDLSKQRQDVRTMDALAWALHANGKDEEALKASGQARRLGTKFAPYLFHAGMIQAKLGHADEATALLREALEVNPKFDPRHAPEAEKTLKIWMTSTLTISPATNPATREGRP